MFLYGHMSIKKALSQLGIPSLRPWQEAPLKAVFQGADVFIRKSTGGGKSLVFQLPATIEKEFCLTIVFSPLRALQVDQVSALREKGIEAALLNSDLSKSERKELLNHLSDVCILYLAPEQLGSKDFLEALKSCRVARVVVDEAHILPQAENGFRKAYGMIGQFIKKLAVRPQIIACTATATNADVKYIAKRLGMKAPRLFLLPVRRTNLNFSIKRIEAKGKKNVEKNRRLNMRHAVERLLNEWDGEGSVIVYCTTVKDVKAMHKWLKSRDWRVGKYTGKMEHDERAANQKSFMSGDKPIMVATNAFGLGIDKPDIRLIIHAGLPLSIEGYVQECGRAGRDGNKSRCILLYSKSDFEKNQRILKRSSSDEELKRSLPLLDALKTLIGSPKCIWIEIEKFFGEKPGGKCGKCCKCKG